MYASVSRATPTLVGFLSRGKAAKMSDESCSDVW